MTHRAYNSHVTFFTGHEDPAKAASAIDYAALAKLGGTQVMLMGVERLGVITSEMLKQGMRSDLPVALVRSATTGEQETLTGTLADIAKKAVASDFKAPAVAEVIPGTISNGIPASAIASASSAPRPKTNGSPPFNRTTCFPSRALSISSVLISCWVRLSPGSFPA